MAMSKGCTITLIVASVLLVIIIIGLGYLWMNKDELMKAGAGKIIDMTEQQIIENIPDGYTPEMVSEIMAELKLKINKDELAEDDVQSLLVAFQTSMEDKQIDVDEAERMLVLIQKSIGREIPIFEENGEEVPLEEEETAPVTE